MQAWYETCGFRKRYSYLHVYLQPDEVRGEVTMRTEGLKPVLTFAHYTEPSGMDEMRRRFKRTHADVLFERAV